MFVNGLIPPEKIDFLESVTLDEATTFNTKNACIFPLCGGLTIRALYKEMKRLYSGRSEVRVSVFFYRNEERGYRRIGHPGDTSRLANGHRYNAGELRLQLVG